MSNDEILTWATAALVVVTAILAVFTGWYASQTKALAEESTKGRRMSAMPVLMCDVEETTRAQNPDECGRVNVIRIRNVGNAPVAEGSMHIELANIERSVWFIETQDKSVGIVGLGVEGVQIPLNEAERRVSTTEHRRDQQPTIDITLRYKSLYGIEFTTSATFELIANQIPSGVSFVPCQWKKLSERMLIQHS